MTTENINIRIREDGSRVVSKNLGGVSDSAVAAADSLDLLKGAALALGGALAIDKLQEWADTWGAASGLIRTSTKTMEEAAAVQDKLFQAAQNTRTEYSAVVELYSRAARAGGDLGASQQDLIKFTEGVGKALAIQGTSATQAAGALFQLGQALTGNKIQAQEYNSLIDQAPELLKVVAQNLDGTGGSIGGLTKLVKDGKVTNKEFFDAFLAGSAQLDERFQQTSNLFSQGWTVITNAVVKYVGELNEALGVSQKFTEFGQWVSDNMPQIAAAVAGLGVAIAVALAPGVIMRFVGALQILWAMVLANPFTALAAALAGVLAYIYILRDEISLGIDETTTLGDLLVAVWEQVAPALQTAVDAVAGFFDWIMASSDTVAEHVVGNNNEIAKHSEASWLRIVRGVAHAIDAILGLLLGLMDASFRIFGAIAGGVVTLMRNASKQLDQVLEGDFKGALQTGLGQVDVLKEMGSRLGSAIGEGLDTGFGAIMEGGLESKLNKAIERAQEISKNRPGTVGGVDLSGALGGGGAAGEDDKDAAKKLRELQRLQNALDNLIGRIDPVRGAMMELAEAQKIFNDAVAKGLIPQAEAERLMARMKEQYKEFTEPLAFLNAQLDEELRIMGLSSKQREIETQMIREVDALRRAGVTLTQEETDKLRAKLVAMQQLTAIMQQQDAILANSSGQRREDFDNWLEAMSGAQASGQMSQGDVFGEANNQLGGLLSGSRDHIQAQLEAQQELYIKLEEMRQADLISEEAYAQGKMQIWANMQSIQLQQADAFFGQLAQLSKSENKKLAAIGKAAAIAQTTIKTYEAATSAYASLAGIPYVGPVLGAAAAAAAIAAGMANVRAIQSQTPGYRTGGEFMVGGGGVSDSVPVNFRATPGERVTITPPGQQGPQQAEAGPTIVPVKIVNPPNREAFLAEMSGDEGERIIMNTLEKNPQRVAAISSAGR